MLHAFQCEIVTAEEQLFSGRIQSVVVPGQLGDMGIYAGHSALISKLRPGVIRLVLEYNSTSQDSIFYVSGGFVEVVPNTITVLAEKVIRAKDIDEKAALEAKRHAQELMSHPSRDLDYARAMVQLTEALAQLRTLAEIRKLI